MCFRAQARDVRDAQLDARVAPLAHVGPSRRRALRGARPQARAVLKKLVLEDFAFESMVSKKSAFDGVVSEVRV
eukprot:2375930-Pleurochrysis_carterae.AAC.2